MKTSAILDSIKPVPGKEVMPRAGFVIYFPRFDQDLFQVPQSEQERVIKKLGSGYGSHIEKALRAAIEDHLFPFQKVVLIIDGGRQCVFIHDLKLSNGEWRFVPEEFINEFPSIDSVMNKQDNPFYGKSLSYEEQLFHARKNFIDHMKGPFVEKVEKGYKGSKASKGFG